MNAFEPALYCNIIGLLHCYGYNIKTKFYFNENVVQYIIYNPE